MIKVKSGFEFNGIIILLPNCITFAAPFAHVVKLVDTSDLGSDAARYGGSSPSMRTFIKSTALQK